MRAGEWSPNRRPRRAGVELCVIVLHSTGGAFLSAVEWLTNPRSKVSAHYVVSRGGEVVKLVPLSDVAYHAGESSWRGRRGVNEFSIGIEMAHVDGQQDWPNAQVIAVRELVRTLRAAFPSIVAVIGHHDVDRPDGRKADPVGFPWEDLALPAGVECGRVR